MKAAGKFDDGNVRLIFSTDEVSSEYKLCITGSTTAKGYAYQLISGPEVLYSVVNLNRYHYRSIWILTQ